MAGILGTILIPLQIVSTLILGLLVRLTFGLLLIPMSLVWMIIFGPLLGLSWLSARFPGGRVIVGILGIPLALIGSIYVQLMPSMGELELRASRLILCETWPFSLEFWRYQSGKVSLEDFPDSDFLKALWRNVGRDPLRKRVIDRIERQEAFDAPL